MPVLRASKRSKSNVCSACSLVFQRHNDLTRHLIACTGKKPYICNHCGKGFAQKSNLKTHENTHTGARPHKCDICPATFGDPSSKTRHRNEKHGGKTYSCSVPGCMSSIKRRQTFIEHLQRKHHIHEKTFDVNACFVDLPQVEVFVEEVKSPVRVVPRLTAPRSVIPRATPMTSGFYLTPPGHPLSYPVSPLSRSSSSSSEVPSLSLGPSPVGSGPHSPEYLSLSLSTPWSSERTYIHPSSSIDQYSSGSTSSLTMSRPDVKPFSTEFSSFRAPAYQDSGYSSVTRGLSDPWDPRDSYAFRDVDPVALAHWSAHSNRSSHAASQYAHNNQFVWSPTLP